MSKTKMFFALVVVITLLVPQAAFSNMGPPNESDVGSSITFEQNDSIAVLSEVLDITVDGSTANIVATYKMKNTSNVGVSTPSMFLSPNIKNSGVKVVANDNEVPFVTESYALNYDTQIETEDWQYAVLTNDEIANRNREQTVDTIKFGLDFAPNEVYDVVVSYTYTLGGYPDVDFDVKVGKIEYYLAPAAMWNGFGGITINLMLDEDMPVMTSSNLEFKKIGNRTYQYVSDTLPEGNLQIVIDENWWQNIFSTLRSPYLSMTIMMFMPVILVTLAVIIFIIWRVRKRKKRA